MGYGFGVMFPVLMFGSVSGAHINPAMTIAQAVNGLFPWSDVLPYIVAQLLGACSASSSSTSLTTRTTRRPRTPRRFWALLHH